VKDGRYFVAPVPVDLDYFRRKKGPRHNKVKAKNRICRLVTVARLEKQKNIPLLLRAFYELRATGYELVVVGEGRERDRIEAEIKKLGLQDKVHLLGQKTREEVRRILWRADVFVLSSDYEGWGLAAVEALAAGVPVVMTDTGCAGEVIINNTTGRVVPKGDAEALTRAIREVRENPEEARKMVLAGQKLLEGQYKRGKLVRQFVAGFKHTL
jgi:glycosyltransferase involved in cell wall biosynthesis